MQIKMDSLEGLKFPLITQKRAYNITDCSSPTVDKN